MRGYLGRVTWGVSILAMATGTAPGARAEDAPLYCGNRLVAPGAEAAEVADLCGGPDQVSTAYVEREGRIWSGDRSQGVRMGEKVIVPVERWVYLARGGSLKRTLTFENGRLVGIRVGG